MSFFAVWTLLALASVVLAAGAPLVRQRWVGPLMTAGFGAGLALFLAGWQVPASVLAGLVALLAGGQLLPRAVADIHRSGARPNQAAGASQVHSPPATDSNLSADVQVPQPADSSSRLGRERARRALALMGAGFLAAQAGVFLRSQGAPALPAFVAAAALPVAAVWLAAFHSHFAPRRLRDEALLFLVASGLCVAAAPGVITGWASAMALNASARGQADISIPGWVLAAVGVATLAGAVSRLWRRN